MRCHFPRILVPQQRIIQSDSNVVKQDVMRRHLCQLIGEARLPILQTLNCIYKVEHLVESNRYQLNGEQRCAHHDY